MAKLLVLLLHNLLFPLAVTLAAPSAMRKMKARGGRTADLWQRFGFFPADLREKLRTLHASGKKVVWMHAASVGEVGIAAKLIQEMLRQEPALAFVLTTTTPTGRAQALAFAERLPEGAVLPLYSALDGWFTVRRFLRVLRPNQVVLVEAEVWPNLMQACQSHRVPVRLVNARLSPRSERRFRKFAFFTRAIFGMLDHVYVQEQEDLTRWESLGLSRARLTHAGSIKFDEASRAEPTEQIAAFRQILRSICGWQEGEPILLAASTHAGEELEFARILLALRGDFPKLHFIMVPRHVERSAAILKELSSLPVNTLLRSECDPARESSAAPASPVDILLVDTTGELPAWQHLATMVIVGKSFLAKGGQNPAEAIAAGKPVLYGPHMENFEALVKVLRSHRGALQVQDLPDLQTQLHRLLQNPAAAQQLAQAGFLALEAHKGATERTARALLGGR